MRKLKNEKLGYLYRSPSTVRIVKSRRMKWTGHLDKMEDSTFPNFDWEVHVHWEDYMQMGG